MNSVGVLFVILQTGGTEMLVETIASILAQDCNVTGAYRSRCPPPFRMRHDYVIVVSERNKVLYVSDDRNQTSLAGYYEGLCEEQIMVIKSASMDMWLAYIRAT